MLTDSLPGLVSVHSKPHPTLAPKFLGFFYISSLQTSENIYVDNFNFKYQSWEGFNKWLMSNYYNKSGDFLKVLITVRRLSREARQSMIVQGLYHPSPHSEVLL